jgi:hypothetical protein
MTLTPFADAITQAPTMRPDQGATGEASQEGEFHMSWACK